MRRFVDEYANYIAKLPNAEKISFVGHSFGTYILASALERYRSIAFHRLYYAGSVVRRGYDWPSYAGRFEQIRNDRAGGDWVVAIFPRLFEQIRDIPLFARIAYFDVGSAGFNGFTHDVASRYDFKYLAGGHGAALDFDANRQQAASIASFILTPKVENAVEPVGLGKQYSLIGFLGPLAWAIWLLLAVTIVGLGYWIWRAAPMGLRTRKLATVCYALVVLFVLNTL